jgi:hypothetical protein
MARPARTVDTRRQTKQSQTSKYNNKGDTVPDKQHLFQN